jgi:protein-S-isoprenylcysteine O-methyltransferase Ste14
MRSIAIAALAAITFLTSMLVGYAPANAVVCARGVYRAGCVGPHGGVVVRHPYYHPYHPYHRRY